MALSPPPAIGSDGQRGIHLSLAPAGHHELEAAMHRDTELSCLSPPHAQSPTCRHV